MCSTSEKGDKGVVQEVKLWYIKSGPNIQRGISRIKFFIYEVSIIMKQANLNFCFLLERQRYFWNRRMVWVEGTLKPTQIQPILPWAGLPLTSWGCPGTHPTWHSTLLGMGHTQLSLSSLCQRTWVKDFLLTSNFDLHSFSLKPFPFLLSVSDYEDKIMCGWKHNVWCWEMSTVLDKYELNCNK